MKMRRAMLAPKHLDHDTEKRADGRHAMTVRPNITHVNRPPPKAPRGSERDDARHHHSVICPTAPFTIAPRHPTGSRLGLLIFGDCHLFRFIQSPTARSSLQGLRPETRASRLRPAAEWLGAYPPARGNGSQRADPSSRYDKRIIEPIERLRQTSLGCMVS
jgi:hypothetical protein